jgi:hypothetical protein
MIEETENLTISNIHSHQFFKTQTYKKTFFNLNDKKNL